MTHTKRERDALIRNSRPLKQTRLDKVPNTIEGRGSRIKHMYHERRLLEKRQILEEKARKKYDELEVIFQQIKETNEKIEEQRDKQTKEAEEE